MKKKWLMAGIAAVMLGGTVTALPIQSSTVQASSYLSGNSYAKKATRYVKVTKKMPVYKVKTGKYEATNKFTRYGSVKKGSKVYISKWLMSTGGVWVIKSKKYYHNKRTFFVVPGTKANWYKKIKKSKKKATKITTSPANPSLTGARFKQRGSVYTYSDNACEITISKDGVQYTKYNGSPYLLFTFTFTNKLKSSAYNLNNISFRTMVSQGNNNYTLRFAPGTKGKDYWTKPGKTSVVKLMSWPLSKEVSPSDSVLIQFAMPHSTQAVGHAIINPTIDSSTANTSSAASNTFVSNSASASPTTSSGQSAANSSSTFTGFPSNIGLISKWQIVKSLSGTARQQAEEALMREMGLYSGNVKLASTSSFEKQMNRLDQTSQHIKNFVEQPLHK